MFKKLALSACLVSLAASTIAQYDRPEGMDPHTNGLTVVTQQWFMIRAWEPDFAPITIASSNWTPRYIGVGLFPKVGPDGTIAYQDANKGPGERGKITFSGATTRPPLSSATDELQPLWWTPTGNLVYRRVTTTACRIDSYNLSTGNNTTLVTVPQADVNAVAGAFIPGSDPNQWLVAGTMGRFAPSGNPSVPNAGIWANGSILIDGNTGFYGSVEREPDGTRILFRLNGGTSGQRVYVLIPSKGTKFPLKTPGGARAFGNACWLSQDIVIVSDGFETWFGHVNDLKDE